MIGTESIVYVIWTQWNSMQHAPRERDSMFMPFTSCLSIVMRKLSQAMKLYYVEREM